MQLKAWQILTLLHATVDALCACCVYMLVSGLHADSVFMVLVVYNCVAFISQAFTGMWIDRIGIRSYAFILSIILLLSGASICMMNVGFGWQMSPIISASVIGLGNSIFHVFGGKYVTNYSRNDMRHLGIFVSTGALGLMLGGMYSSIIGMATIMGIMSVLSLLLIRRMKTSYEQSAKYYHSNIYSSLSSGVKYGVPLFLFILLIVAFRSFLGKMVPLSASNIPWFAVVATLLAVFGKASGGFIAERIGAGTALLVTLLISGGCFLLGYYHYAFILAMLFFINLSMPVTLHLANRCCPGHEGFAFGILAAFLIPGYALGMVSVGNPFAYHLLYPLISTILIEAAVLLLLRERRWNVLMMSVVMNILTNVPLNIYVGFSYHDLTYIHIILLEVGVVLVETILYYAVTRDIRKSIFYSVLCNAMSYLLGFLFLTFIK